MAYSPNSKGVHMAVADEEFTCPMCCDIFEEPKLLPNCAHSFCKACLRELTLRSVNSGQVSCPICRKMSNVPQNGVEGFPTNTLLVRLIDNIPGQKDKQLVVKALGRCKEEITKNKDVQEQLEKKLSKIQDNKEQGLKLKRDITEHAQQAIDSIRKWEQGLCKEVDLYLAQNCGLDFHERLEKLRNKWKNYMNQASACVKSADEMLNRNQMEEILEMKNAMIEQLNEYSSFPLCPLLKKADKIQDFAMQFDKLHVKQDLGKVDKPGKKEPLLSAKNANSDSVHKIPSVFCSSSRSESTASASSGSVSVKNSGKREITLEVPLQFAPFRMAVCPRSGDIALLWEEERQVHLISSDGVFLKKIVIKYGDLWDVGFTIDDEVVVVNRAHNRLLLYEKDGQFVSFEVEMPRDSLKFTYVSVDSGGRLIVTSTSAICDDNGDEVVPCIVVYNNACGVSCKMFGKRQLKHPASRAICHNGQFYIADECDVITIKVFSYQGQHIINIPLPETSSNETCLSTMPHSNMVFVHDRINKSVCYILVDHTIGSKKQQNPYRSLQQALVMSNEPDGPAEQLEIYKNKRCLCRVKYY